MRLKKLKDWNLRSKIVLHVIVISLIAVFFMTFFCTRTQQSIITKMSRQKARLIGTIIENSIFTSMKAGKSGDVQSILDQITRSEDIERVRILSPSGDILNSSEILEIGKSTDEETRENLQSILSLPQTPAEALLPAGLTIAGYRVIDNLESCHSCHGSQAKINGILQFEMNYADVSALLKSNRVRQIVTAILALILLTFIILRLFEKIINRPLSRLKSEMRKVQDGDLNVSSDAYKKDEIGGLAESYRTMVHKLNEANRRIQELFDKQMEKAEHLASLGEMAAGLAHEIKNPIAGMKGALEIINKKTETSDPKKEIYEEMLLQIDRIDHIIHDLLSYAKPKEMNIKFLNPNECIETAIRLAKPQFKEKDIRIFFERTDSGTQICIDPDKIQEVMLNLLANSIAAIKEKGTISIHTNKPSDKEFEIVFSDDGTGIKKEHISQIFHPFFTTKSRGTGLGLSICKKIIEAHGGTMKVRSEAEKGTAFSIRLPITPPCE